MFPFQYFSFGAALMTIWGSFRWARRAAGCWAWRKGMVLGINLSLSSPPKLSLSTWLAQQWSDFPHQPEKNGFLTRILSICKSHADEALKIAGPSQCWPSWVLHAAWTLQWLSLCLLDLLLFLIFTRPWHSTVYLEKVRPKGEAIRKGSQQTSGSQSKGKNSRKLTGSWKNVPSLQVVLMEKSSNLGIIYLSLLFSLTSQNVHTSINFPKISILKLCFPPSMWEERPNCLFIFHVKMKR